MLKFPFFVPEYLKCKLNEDSGLYLTHFIFTNSQFYNLFYSPSTESISRLSWSFSVKYLDPGQ